MGETGSGIKPGSSFGALREKYAPLRKDVEEKLKQAGITEGAPFRKARHTFARYVFNAEQKGLDFVTGLPLRSEFEKRLQDEVERAKRFGHPTTMVFIDVNNLKKINSERGHPTGDKALKAIADILGQNERKIDYAARWGGDEFAVLLPETPIAGVDKWWERVSERMKAIPYTVTATAIEIDPNNVEQSMQQLSDKLVQTKEQHGRTKSNFVKIAA